MTDRQYNLDLLKAVAIIAMVFCHPVIRLGMYHEAYLEDFAYFFADDILGDFVVAAHGLMFAMGVGMAYSRRKAPADLIRRGVKLFLAGYVLNFLRYGIYALVYAVISGEFLDETMTAMFGPDILQFAGLAFIATGLFRKAGMSEKHILAASLILSVIGTLIPAGSTGSAGADLLLGLFVFTKDGAASFVFCSWYLFAAAGLEFGTILRRTEDKDQFYHRLTVISGCIAAIYIVLMAAYGLYCLSPNRNYYTPGIPEAIGFMSIDLLLLSGFYYLLKKVDVSRFAVMTEMSRNITYIYFIHWIILGFIEAVCCYLLEIVFPYPVIYMIGALLLAVSFMLARCLRSVRYKRIEK